MPTRVIDRLQVVPDEVVLQILSYLDVNDLVRIQLVAIRYSILARDASLWKSLCFEHSRSEARRRRQQLLDGQDARLTELRNAVTTLPGGDLTAWDVAQLVGRSHPRAALDPEAEARLQRTRAMANWEPGYPTEKLDYYQDYVHRHASVNLGWLDLPKAPSTDAPESREAVGLGVIQDRVAGSVTHAVAPLDDGCICVWDISARSSVEDGGGAGRLLGASKPGLLTGTTASSSHGIMTETGAIECVCVDSTTQKGYFAVRNDLREVDLNTLQLASSKRYPFPITALSRAEGGVPPTVGTNMTIHLFDARDGTNAATSESTRGELIGGSVYSHATLAQPGPLSILHSEGFASDDSSIWVAGRFTSLLNYDRRCFPRLRQTIHSGARVASMMCLPHPFVPRSLDLVRNPQVTISALQEARREVGHTLAVAAEYKGKGSLELYGIPQIHAYQNRQTASASKLLSVASHGGRIVYSDGDGNLKWVERDGFSYVRTCNINEIVPANQTKETPDTHSSGIWNSSGSEVPGHGDIVQKIVPTNVVGSPMSSGGRIDVNQNNLLVWTGDGRLGVVGFGPTNPLSRDAWHDAVEVQARSVQDLAREDAERQYGMAMRRALERNADEVRFVRGLGMM